MINPANVPKEIKYDNLKELSIPSKVNRKTFIPTSSGNYDQNNRTITTYISDPSAMMDTSRSYLDFQLNVEVNTPAHATLNTASKFICDTSYFSAFGDARIYDGSGSMIYECVGWGNWMSKLAQTRIPRGTLSSTGSFSGMYDPTVPASTTSVLFDGQDSTTTNTGKKNHVRNCRIPLWGLGPLSMTSGENPKLFPLAFLRAGLRLEIDVINYNPFVVYNLGSANAGVPVSTVTWSISNFKLVATLAQYSPEFINQYKQIIMSQYPDGKFLMSSYAWKNQTLPVAGNEFSAQLASSAKSIKSVLFYVRNTADLNSPTRFKSASVYKRINNVQLNLGGSLYPSTPISEPSTFYAELCNALGGSDLNGSINFASYTSDNTVSNTLDTVDFGKFIGGVDMESILSYMENGYNNQSTAQPVIVQGRATDSLNGCAITICMLCDMTLQVDLVSGTITAAI